MKITDIKIRKLLDTSKMRAIASVTFENALVVHDIKVIESSEKLFLAMPSRQLSNGNFADVAHPVNSEFRKILEDAVINQYKKAKETLNT